jgi:hypothetical protein
MRAMRAEGFSGYKDLMLVDIPNPVPSRAPHESPPIVVEPPADERGSGTGARRNATWSRSESCGHFNRGVA